MHIGIDQGSEVVHLGIFRAVLVFVKPTARPVGTAVAGTWGTVTPGAAEGFVLRAVRGALPLKGAFAVVVTFQRHLAFVGKCPVESDFLADSGLIFADGLSNGSLSGTIDDSSMDDPPFL